MFRFSIYQSCISLDVVNRFRTISSTTFHVHRSDRVKTPNRGVTTTNRMVKHHERIVRSIDLPPIVSAVLSIEHLVAANTTILMPFCALHRPEQHQFVRIDANCAKRPNRVRCGRADGTDANGHNPRLDEVDAKLDCWMGFVQKLRFDERDRILVNGGVKWKTTCSLFLCGTIVQIIAVSIQSKH